MVQRRKRTVQACVVIKNCCRAVNINRRAELLRHADKIDILAVQMPVAITKGMHVVAAFVSNAEAKISGAWHKRLYHLRAHPPPPALPNHPQADIENRDQSYPDRKACEYKFFSVLQHFSKDGVCGQVEKS